MRFLRAAAFAILMVSQSGTSSPAQNWPARAVTLVVPFAPGGGTDVLGRIVARRLSETLGQQVIVENVGGAGGMMGSARVAKSPPDGYQFVLGSRADAINQTLYKTPLYNLMTDLEPVVLVADQPTVMVARPDLPVNGLQEFIAYAKANQGKMQFGSAGAGSTGFIDCALFNAAIGVNITHVPYRGGGPAMQDLIGGRIDYFCTLTGTAVPQIAERHHQGGGGDDQGPRADAAEPAEHLGTGLQGVRGLDLVRLLRAEGHARAGDQAAARRNRRGDRHAVGAGAASEVRLAGGRARPPLDGVSAQVHRNRDRQERRTDPGGRNFYGLISME